MSARKVVSLSLIFSFLSLLLTGIVLYVVPAGRIAYWANWTFLGLTKEQWGALHTTSGFVGLLVAAFHIYFNWTPIVHYLKNRRREVQVLNSNSAIALAITVWVIGGTLYGIPPFNWVLDLGESIKDAAAESYGEPPYAHAELSTFERFARTMGIDAEGAVAALRQQGMAPDSMQQTIRDLASKHSVAPQELYAIMEPTSSGTSPELPDAPPPGLGRKSLAAICEQYGLSLEEVQAYLRDRGIAATAGSPLKEIAEANGTDSHELYDMLREYARSMED
jgi:hypothetical protein